MKRKSVKNKGIALFLVMAMAAASMTGCGGKEASKEPAKEIDFADITGNSNSNNSDNAVPETPDVQEPATEQAPVEESREGMYRSEITNEWIDESLKNQRPIAVMVDNEKTALPHYGLTEADVVYEMMNSTANGRITRFMAIVKDWGKIQQFGSIRSTRSTNIMLAAEWNAVLCHDGGPFYVDEWLARKYSANFSGGFSRVDNGKKREFTEYICAGDLEKKFSGSKYSTEYNDYYPGQHYFFSDSEIDLSTMGDARSCTEIELPFPHNSSRLQYNESTGTYDYYEYGQAHTDPQHGNAQLTFKNLLIQNTTFKQLDENGYLIYNAIDSGRDAYYITNGKAIEVTWIKAGESDKTIYLNKQTGEEIELNTGKTYVALVPSDSWSSVVIK
ncbi:MAG: DUF3048 domain-containing protein [Lachnospiraceae bacterium]|nr:DUF3048 domain-containing protein [Lachnospiraceae bacterium]